MDQKRLILAAFLSLVVLLAWSYFFQPPKTVPIEAPVVVAEPTTEPDGGATAAVGESTETESVDAATARETIGAEAEQRVEVDTEVGHAVFSNRGAQMLSYRVNEVTGHDGKPLEMVRARAEGPYPFALTDPSGSALSINDALFAVEGPERGPTGISQIVRFEYSGDAGTATKEFRFLENGLIEVAIHLDGKGPWGVVMGPGLRNPAPEELQSKGLFRGASYLAANELETHQAQKLREEVRVAAGGIRWTALEDTYFLSMVAPKTPLSAVAMQPFLMTPGAGGAPPTFQPRPPPERITDELEDLPQEIRLVLTSQTRDLEADAYWGAKRYRTLSELPTSYELTRTIRWGTFGLIARPMLQLLLWIHDNVVANYGWAIVILTFVIKLVLLPLTHKSYVSMQKMQKLQPKIEAIKQKHRGKQRDAKGRPNLEGQRKMNEEMQELFKAEGVNPAGGCLPLLLQMPVFFAFFALLRNSVELWNAPWLGWIHDLSAADPWYVLPIVTGIAQFVQQRMTPATTANPSQRVLLNTMPIWFTVISFGFASGLVLYWLTNNLLTIVQQWTYQRLKRAGYLGGPETAPAVGAPAARKERAARVKKR
ncbi:MAG TPA: membrane protein insertase YidC [Thermoanaerobaculia bacterium]|nr:membrane protein insertase YidC [Thermoanaerobaculia bacterium]